MQTLARHGIDSDGDADVEVRPCGLCLQCVMACPTGALQYNEKIWSLDLSRCRFCRECAMVCPNSLISEIPI